MESASDVNSPAPASSATVRTSSESAGLVPTVPDSEKSEVMVSTETEKTEAQRESNISKRGSETEKPKDVSETDQPIEQFENQPNIITDEPTLDSQIDSCQSPQIEQTVKNKSTPYETRDLPGTYSKSDIETDKLTDKLARDKPDTVHHELSADIDQPTGEPDIETDKSPDKPDVDKSETLHHDPSTEKSPLVSETDKPKDLPVVSSTDTLNNDNMNIIQESSQIRQAEQPSKFQIQFKEPIVTDNEELVRKQKNKTKENKVTDNKDLPGKPKCLYTEDKGPSFYHIKSNLATKPIITKNLPSQFASLPIFGTPVKRNDLSQFYSAKIKAFVGDDLTDDEFDKLAKYCSPDHLKTGGEICMPLKAPTHGILPSDSDEKLALEKSSMYRDTTGLCIHKKYQLRIDKDLGNLYNKRLKYRGIRLVPLSTIEDSKKDATETDKPDLVPGKDMLYRVRVYRPYDYNIKYFRGRSRHATFSCDIVLSGKQKLTALRDRIVCANDVSMRVDVSSNPDDMPTSSAKDVFPSGFLFINNVFYVDTRVGCVDHAAPVREWAKRKNVGDFPSKDMCDTTLEDIVLKLGFPEVYVHQGNCEHLFTFSEIRLVGPSDPLRLSQYPANTASAGHQSVYCTTCAEFGAKWIVVGCARVPFDPAFFCETCFRLYLYKDGEKIGDFKAYAYKGNELNMLKPILD